MCTVTWLHEEGGYHLFCNRDEKLTRKPELPLRLGVRDGVRYLAPIDGDFGGTWIATNEFGVSLCLLNGTAGLRPAVVRSRGLLLLDLVSSRSLEEVVDTVEATDLTLYAPFTLAALSPGKAATVIEWDGSRSVVRSQPDLCYMLTSSSFETDAVKKARAEEFARLVGKSCSAGRLQVLHRSHAPSRSACSPCMHRPDAETVSFSQVHVSSSESRLIHFSAAPCNTATGRRVDLRIAAGAVAVESTTPRLHVQADQAANIRIDRGTTESPLANQVFTSPL
jgi:hypothetical protein